MSTAPFPHRYSVALGDDQLSTRGRSPIPIGPPPQFGGTGTDDWSPEELLLGALVGCLKTTFDAYARRGLIRVTRFQARTEGVLAKTAEGPAFSSVTIHVEVSVDGTDDDVAEAKATLERAEHDCIVSRAIKAPVILVAVVHGASVTAPERDSAGFVAPSTK